VSTFNITKEIGLDMGHRVTNHASKCRNVHGHRYRVEAVIGGNLFNEGSQEGMVLDFGFLKQALTEAIHDVCDHGMMFWSKDPVLESLDPELKKMADSLILQSKSYACITTQHEPGFGKLLISNFVPTAENLSKYWFEVLQVKINEMGYPQVQVVEMRVWETPTSLAIYRG
jgi:6-pyruvoyltetrahydropterin/6-carboxytetrahydropterin synthase